MPVSPPRRIVLNCSTPIDFNFFAGYSRHMYHTPRPSHYQRHPPKLRAKAIALRRQGYSLNELRDLLTVPKLTIQGWVKDVRLSAKAKKRIRWRILEGGGKVARARARVVNGQTLEAWKRGIQNSSRLEVSRAQLTPELGRLLCAVMYSCEGSKYPSARLLGFANSDPRMIRLFLHLLRMYFVVDEKRFRCQIPHRCDQDMETLIRYWSGVTNIPQEQFYRNKADQRTKGKPTLRKDYRGVCYVQYFSTTLQFTLQSIGEALMDRHGEGNGGAGENRTLNPAMPLRCDPISPQPLA